LEALAEALRADDTRLDSGTFATGMTYESPMCMCAVGYAVWRGGLQLTTVDVRDRCEDMLNDICNGGDWKVTGCRPGAFTAWFDMGYDSDRLAMYAELLPEVERAIVTKKAEPFARLGDEWWESANAAFHGMTPEYELRTNGRDRLEMMIHHLDSGVAS
jgi:hypothetical protein